MFNRSTGHSMVLKLPQYKCTALKHNQISSEMNTHDLQTKRSRLHLVIKRAQYYTYTRFVTVIETWGG